MLRSLLSFTGLVRVCYSCWGWCRGWRLGAGDVEVDITYITFMRRAQHTGLVGTVQGSHTTTEITCT